MNGLALCAGHAGLELGIHLALGERYRTVCYVERDAYAAACLVARMADAALDSAPVWDDLRTFDGRPWRGVVDIVSGGYPCQPFSVAGKQLGAADPRHLWPDVFRVVREIGARWVYFENVAAHLVCGFDAVLRDLRSAGYRVAAGVFSAEAVGAPHLRERLFILGELADTQCPSRRAEQFQQSGEGSRGAPGAPDGSMPGVARDGMADAGRRGDDAQQPEHERGGGGAARTGGAGAALADTGRAQRRADDDGGGGGAQGCHGEGEAAGGSGECGAVFPDATCTRCGQVEQQSAWPQATGATEWVLPLFPPGPGDGDGWRECLSRFPALEPAVCGVADGLAYRVDRLRGCGNGVVPIVAAEALVCLAGDLAAGRVIDMPEGRGAGR